MPSTEQLDGSARQAFVAALAKANLEETTTIENASEIIATYWMKSHKLTKISQLLDEAKMEVNKLTSELKEKDRQLENAKQRISQVERREAFISGVTDDMESAIRVAAEDWPIAVKDYKFDIFISYRVKTESILANELYLFLQLYPKLDLDFVDEKRRQPIEGRHRNKVFLDQHLLQDGEDWQKGFLDGLKQSRLVILLVSTGALVSLRRSHLWVDNVLLEWETALIAADQKKCAVLPVWLGEKEEPFDFEALQRDLAAGVYPSERPRMSEKTQCYLSATTTLKKLLQTPGVFLRDRSQLKELLPRITQKFDAFLKDDKSSFDKAVYLFDKLPYQHNKWTDNEAFIERLPTLEFPEFCREALPYNSSWLTVQLSDIHIGDKQLEAIIDSIVHGKEVGVSKVKSLQLLSCTLQINKWSLFGDLFAAADGSKLDTLRLDRTRIGAEETKLILEAVRGIRGISTLEIEGTNVNENGLRFICDAFAQHGMYHITSLELSEIGVGGAGDGSDENMFTELIANSSLKSLSLPSNEFSSKDGALFGAALEKTKILESLDLHSNSIQSGAQSIFRSMCLNSTLRKLDLSENELADDVVESIGEMLKSNKGLRELLLTENAITNLAPIFEGLVSNTSLEHLELDSNSCNTESAKVLATVLKKNNALKYLGLDMTDLGDDAVTEIANALAENTVLETLDIERNPFGDVAASALATALKTNSTLKELCLAGSSDKVGLIKHEGAKALSSALEVNRTIEKLTLGSQSFGSDGAAAISAGLAKNPASRLSLINTLLVSADTIDASTQLHIAVKENYLSIVEELVKTEGLDINRENESGDSALHVAIKHGATQIVKVLLENKADPELQNQSGQCPLHLAVKYGGKDDKVKETEGEGHGNSAEAMKRSQTVRRSVTLNEEDVAPVVKQAASAAQSREDKFSVVRKELIMSLLQVGKVNIDATNTSGETALQLAIGAGYVDIIRLLIDQKATIYGRELHDAVSNKDIVNFLLRHDADIDCVEPKQLYRTALMVAAQKGYDDTVELLCDQGADKSVVDAEGYCAVGVAVIGGLPSTVRLLLQKGAGVNGGSTHEVGVQPHTPLCAALEMCNDVTDRKELEKKLDIARILLKSGADPNKLSSGETPLGLAVRYATAAFVKELLYYGAHPNGIRTAEEDDVEGGSGDRMTPLFRAIERKRNAEQAEEHSMEIAKILLSSGRADVRARCQPEYSNLPGPAPMVLYAATGNMHEIVELLLENGARPDEGYSVEGELEVTPLAVAIGSADWDDEDDVKKARETIRILLKNKADPNKAVPSNVATHWYLNLSEAGRPLTFLVEKGDVEMVRELLDHGADINAQNLDDIGSFALLRAVEAEKNTMELVELLIERGAHVNQKSKTGYSAHSMACQIDDEELGVKVREFLRSKGADVHAVDEDGDTAMHYAAYRGFKHVVEELEKLGVDSTVLNKNGKSAAQLLEEYTPDEDEEGEEEEDGSDEEEDEDAEAKTVESEENGDGEDDGEEDDEEEHSQEEDNQSDDVEDNQSDDEEAGDGASQDVAQST
ncbi:hypothetical protein BJ742DRAFT_834377 [Cladochytrium replicatum]|nr:hypothetical protein BJ742DRAFT_834377 [Cladochytrium replicatum]